MLKRYLLNLYGRLRYPQDRRLAYTFSGLGIEYRRKNWASHWEPHILASKAVQAEWANTANYKSSLTLLVLGAGRLFDLNDEALCPTINQISLVDADPLVLPTWKEFAAKHPKLTVLSELREITGKLKAWSELFSGEIRRSFNNLDIYARWQHVLGFLYKIGAHPLPLSTDIFNVNADAILSLNLLSQLPMQWQMFLERELVRAFTKSWVKEHEEEWLKACAPSCRQLVEEHLAFLNASMAKTILLITDLEYIHYQGTELYSSRVAATPPLNWQPHPADESRAANYLALGNWHPAGPSSEKTNWELFSSLYGVDLEHLPSLQRFTAGYEINYRGSWLWHIAPQGLESQTYGYLHRVGAFIFTKITSG